MGPIERLTRERDEARRERDEALARMAWFVLEAAAMPEPVDNPDNEYIHDWQVSYDQLRELVSETLPDRARAILDVVRQAQLVAESYSMPPDEFYKKYERTRDDFLGDLCQAVSRLNAMQGDG